MWKYIKAVIRIVPGLIVEYFVWIRKYSNHPERYPLELRYAKVRKLLTKVSKAFNVTYVLKNYDYLKSGKTYLFVGNHLSMWDAVLFLTIAPHPILFLAKVETKKMLFVYRILKILNCRFINRGAIKEEVRVMLDVKESLKKNESSWIIFPEGTRIKVYDGQVGEFHPGTFKPAMSSQTTIIPFALWGSQDPLSFKNNTKEFRNYVSFLTPISPEEYSGKNTIEVAKDVQSRIQKEVQQLMTQAKND